MGSPPGNGIAIADLGFIARKKRSCGTRRPCSEPQRVLGTYGFFPQSTSAQSSGAGYGEESLRLSQHTAGEKNGLKKLKLKVGGVTRTIHTKAAAEYGNGGASASYASKHTEKQHFQNSNFGKEKVLKGKISNENECEPTRKSKRVPKRRKLDLGFDEDDDYMDEEICYLGRINATRVSADCEDYEGGGTEAGIMEVTDIGRVKRSEKPVEDDVYMVEREEELASDDVPECKIKKSGFVEGKNDRDRVVKQDVSLRSSSALVEFPDGLPDAPKKSKANFPDVDKQLKKAEAAQKRKLHAEKLAKEAEAEAIRKILGQDSSRKKKEEKMKKQRDDVAQVKASKGDELGANTIRWVIGPSGTTVTFSNDVGLPRILSSTPCSYPPSREKCAGPNCTNAYKYRDSKLKLPLCSLHCYKAIQEKVQPLITC
ncbi:unnamed protein product [Linum tenue]|uniref:INO80 complex subunit B-like conserved region domain-containing protein n=1 Tax=Linum tenue TaxID=586396 RepID=A0AAV0S325_9ROSI|nr:unnamed protein product [Linum tenue]CAI0626610.1 unnamed protein product [Linum tenue]